MSKIVAVALAILIGIFGTRWLNVAQTSTHPVDGPQLAEVAHTQPAGYIWVGYTYGGVTFAMPEDCMSFEVSKSDQARGILMIVANKDCMLQLRQFNEVGFTLSAYEDMIRNEPAADMAVRDNLGTRVVCCRNMQPTASSELYAMVLEGLDGLVYKVSVFTGDDERFDDEAKVWEIAETIADTVRTQDFSGWGAAE